jgi:hypothetical protein
MDCSNRLVRHDGLIVAGTARTTFAGGPDRLIAAAMLAGGLLAVHVWFAGRPWTAALWAAAVAGGGAGFAVGQGLAVRLAYHRLDGLLAADALHPARCRHYILTGHTVGLASVMVVTAIARPSLLIASVPAYAAGSVLAYLVSARDQGDRRAFAGEALRRWLRHPGAGGAAATILLLALGLGRSLPAHVFMACVGVVTLLLLTALAMVDDAVIRFRLLVGHRPWRIVGDHAQALLVFAGVAVPAGWFVAGRAVAAIIAGLSAAMLLVLAIRILAYCLHGRRLANLLVSILTGLTLLVGYALPASLPLFAIMLLWRLQRRADARRWALP